MHFNLLMTNGKRNFLEDYQADLTIVISILFGGFDKILSVSYLPLEFQKKEIENSCNL